MLRSPLRQGHKNHGITMQRGAHARERGSPRGHLACQRASTHAGLAVTAAKSKTAFGSRSTSSDGLSPNFLHRRDLEKKPICQSNRLDRSRQDPGPARSGPEHIENPHSSVVLGNDIFAAANLPVLANDIDLLPSRTRARCALV